MYIKCKEFTIIFIQYCGVGNYYSEASRLIRSTTGTEVHGIFPNSVTTMAIRSGEVTSYTKLSRLSDLMLCHSDKKFSLEMGTKSDGSPE